MGCAVRVLDALPHSCSCSSSGFVLHLASMNDLNAPKLSKWPFFLGDALLLGIACFITYQSRPTLGHWDLCFVVLCVVGGALLSITPFLIEYDALVKVTEAGGLTTVVSQLKNIEGIAGQISGATSQWQDVQCSAEKTANAAREIGDRMTSEVKAFTEFMQRANDTEKANLRLEVDKLRRAEGDWIQVLVRMMDHVFALHHGALPRRGGLTHCAANGADPFDAQRHQLIEEGAKAPPDAVVSDTVAAGYT